MRYLQVTRSVSRLDQVQQTLLDGVNKPLRRRRRWPIEAQALSESVAVFNIGDSDSVSAPLAAIPRRIPARRRPGP